MGGSAIWRIMEGIPQPWQDIVVLGILLGGIVVFAYLLRIALKSKGR
jgi:hypothetical protein